MSRPRQLKSGTGHRYNLVIPMVRANPCTIIPKTTPSADEGYTMGGLGLGVMEVRKAWLCGWYERLKELKSRVDRANARRVAS